LITDIESLEEAVANHAARVGEKPRRQGSVASGLYVYIRTNPFREGDRQYSNGVALPLIPATAHSGRLIASAREGLKRVFRPNSRYKKAGVMALDISSARPDLAQGKLFASRTGKEREVRLMAALDGINRRFGDGSLRYASQGTPGQGDWRMRREMLSPLYPTRWEDAPIVR
jgi:DNA polymerase V